MDGVSIAARGAVYSVVVAHQGPLAEIQSIELDPASETSVVLLQLLLREKKLGAQISRKRTGSDPRQARLLIGDQAIRFRAEHGKNFAYWDLGQAWVRLTDLPFVFALWLIRAEVTNPVAIATELRRLLRRNLAHVEDLAASQNEVPRNFCQQYYTEHLSFDLAADEKGGLREFHRRCLTNSIAVTREFKPEFV